MKADCFAVANAKDETLFVRGLGEPLEKLAESLKVLREQTGERDLVLFRSFVDGEGKEVFAEVFNPWLDAYLRAKASGASSPEKLLVEVWHAKQPTFGLGGLAKSYAKTEFDHVANFIVPQDSEDWTDSLNVVYAKTQNIDSGWRPRRPCRSSSVGDVFVVKRPDQEQAYVVAMVGFEPTELLNS